MRKNPPDLGRDAAWAHEVDEERAALKASHDARRKLARTNPQALKELKARNREAVRARRRATYPPAPLPEREGGTATATVPGPSGDETEEAED